MARQRPGQFLSASGIRRSPLRRFPQVADEPETVDRIREARALQDEPEVICDDAILIDWSEVALFHQSKRHAEEVAEAQRTRPELDPEVRVAAIVGRAKQAHVDLSREVFIMRAEIKRARGGGRHVPERTIRRIEGLEALLDGVH
jgi:hypothetical protein